MSLSNSGQSTRKVIKDQTVDDDGEVMWTTMAIQGTCMYWYHERVEKFWGERSGSNSAAGKSSIVSLRPMWRA